MRRSRALFVELFHPDRLAVCAEPDFLDARFSLLQQRLAARFQFLAALVKLDAFVQSDLSTFQPSDDILKPFERLLEGQAGGLILLFVGQGGAPRI